VTLGRPLANVTVRVLDEALEPVPVGVPGELCVAGAGLAHGYVDRPDLTAERFVPDPIGRTPGARLYRTGDRVRYRSDGIFEFLGRFDHQLKVRGVRVEAGEVEALLRQHPQVRAAVVTATARSGGHPLLAAYVVPGEPAPSDVDLRRHLAAHLPASVLPSAFCFLPALLITPNGKVDRRALPAPTLADAGRTMTAPRTETERLLVEMWTDALRIADIGVDDDFFALGGHSLAAARLASRLRESFGVELPVRAVFETPTIAGLARLIDRRRRAAQGSERLPLVTVPREGPLPLSFAQQGFWLLEQLEPGNPIYVNAEIIRLRGPFSAREFAEALTGTVARHEVLRTTFHTIDGEPRQIVEPPWPVDVPVVDLVRFPPRGREAAAASFARAEARRPFDLTRAPLVRATVLRLSPTEHIVLFSVHHVVADLWSIGVLMTELSAGYRAARAGAMPSLPDLPVQYGDYAVWERLRWREEALDAAVARRRGQIGDDIAELDLPTDRPRGLSPRLVGARRSIQLPAELMTRVRESGRQQGATLFMSLVAALETLLHLYTGQEGIAIAVPVANREEPATEGLIGYFVNHVIVATRFDGDPTCRELLARARTATLDALDQQDLPFEEFIRRLRPERRGSHTPLHRVLFNLMNVANVRLELPGIHVEVAPPAAVGTARFDLQWTFVDHGDSVSGELEYDRELFDPATAERMTSQFVRLLQAFVDSPDRRLATLGLMSAAQESLALAFNEPI
jgi:acyl carrier protein